MMRQNRSIAGFTLIELIMTIVVVGVLSIPLSLFIIQHTDSVFQSAHLSIARQLARCEIERVNNLDYANINSINFLDYDGYHYDVTRTVSYAFGDAASQESLKKITVEIFKSGSSEVLVKLVTYIAKNISYGL